VAGNPIQRGGSWQVRWRHPDKSLAKRDYSAPVWDKRDGELLRDWLNGLMETSPKVKNAAFPDDDEIKYGVFRGGTIPLKVTEPEALTFGEYAERLYAAKVKAKTILPRTKKRWTQQLRNHAKDWWLLPLPAIDRDRLEAKLLELATKPQIKNPNLLLSGRTQNTLIVLIASVLKAAHNEGQIPRNLFAADTQGGNPKIKIARAETVERMREDEEIYLPPDEWKKILLAAADIDEAACGRTWIIKPEVRHLHEAQTVDMLWLLADTGCRISEIHGLLVRHGRAAIRNLSEPVLPIHVQRQYDERGRPVEAPPKGGKKGSVAISEDLARRLQKYVGGRELDASLFPSPRRGDAGWVYGHWWNLRWRKTLERAQKVYGLDPVLRPAPHSIRHTTATWLFDAGLESRDVATNHRHIDTTMVETVYGKQSTAQGRRLREAKASFPRPAGVVPAAPAASTRSRAEFIATYMAGGLSEKDATTLADAYGLTDDVATA
jgi:integrase